MKDPVVKLETEKQKLGKLLKYHDKIEQLQKATELGFVNPYKALELAIETIAGRSALDRRYRRPDMSRAAFLIALDRELRCMKYTSVHSNDNEEQDNEVMA